MKTKILYIVLLGSFISIAQVKAQVKYKIENGQIHINDGSIGRFNEKAYSHVIDSLEKNLKSNPHDTSSLFEHALLMEQSNNQLAKSTSYTKDPIQNLLVAKDMVERAVQLNMKDLSLKILRAQIYKDLVYRYSVNESWKFTSKQIADRKAKLGTFKGLANTYYDELVSIDPRNAYDYQKLKIK